MPSTTLVPSRGTIGAAITLTVLALFFWMLLLTTLPNLSSSDAAGNGLTQLMAAAETLVLWLVLAILMVVAVVNNPLPLPLGIAAFVLVFVSGIVAMMALALLTEPLDSPFLWPMIIPALVPPLIIAFCFWTLVPSIRAAIPAPAAIAVAGGGTLLLCLAIVPFNYLREQAIRHQAAAREQYAADFAKLAKDAPLWEWTPFLATADDTRRAAVLDGIRHLERRQSDAEIMLDRGDFPLGYLGQFGLDPTAPVCDKARALLRRQVEPLVLKTPNTKPYADIADAVADAVAAMEWLVGYGCSCDAESRAWETMANGYRDTDFDVVRLAELRDPKELGRILREDPDSFSMLTPQSHLRAWLKFAADKNLHDQALAGARTLDHRTADTVEMLNDNEFAAATVMAYLPELDLDPTPALCAAALKEQFRELVPVYRPTSDDPRPYRQLLERLGGDEAFDPLIWLASHGCDAEPELKQAEDLVRSYQDSPRRAATLAALEEARHTP
jgi:hypothetical protein